MKTQIGKSYWFDLPATDIVNAMAFYEGLFGWTFVKLSEPVVDDYYVIQQGDELIGGLRRRPLDNRKKMECDAPVLYFTVEQLEPAVSRAKELGAKLVGTRVDMGKSRGSYQWIRDREENLVALWGPQ